MRLDGRGARGSRCDESGGDESRCDESGGDESGGRESSPTMGVDATRAAAEGSRRTQGMTERDCVMQAAAAAVTATAAAEEAEVSATERRSSSCLGERKKLVCDLSMEH
ncbi:uncharacterized protein DS421_2g54810 [Arachis hypogaea]|nr:uncharacterized protein DS421_2g54810 [Arachis hypogaea]